MKKLDTHCGLATNHKSTAPATPKPRQQGHKRTHAEHTPDQLGMTKYTTQTPHTQTPSSAESTPEPSLAMTPAQGHSDNKLTREEGEKHLKEKERNSGEASVPSESEEEFQVVSPDSSSDASLF